MVMNNHSLRDTFYSGYCARFLAGILALNVLVIRTVDAGQTMFTPELTGKVVSEQNANPLPGAVVSVLWFLQNQNAKSASPPTLPLLFAIKQVHCDRDGHFTLPAEQTELPEGMILAPGKAPILRIYATGYHRLEMPTDVIQQNAQTSNQKSLRVSWNGAEFKMQPLANKGDATLLRELLQAQEQTLQQWREDIDTVIASPNWQGDTNKGLIAQAELVRLFAKNCLLVAADIQQRVCLIQNSPVASYLRMTTLEKAAHSLLQPSDGPLLSIVTPDPEQQPPKTKIVVTKPTPEVYGVGRVSKRLPTDSQTPPKK
ncbi:MAG: hypothetical protein QG652_228 [Pseudomonadota bacterium]|nr:hypothetical protein [Pseudomonadota bacterium]